MNYFKFWGLCAFCVALTACSDKKEEEEVAKPEPVTPSENVLPGNAFVLGTGIEGNAISGEVGLFDLSTGKITCNLFANANGRSLGMTSNDMAINTNGNAGLNGDYEACFAVTTSNVIEFVSLPSMLSVAHIELADSAFEGPRRSLYNGNYVYVTMKSGHLVRLDAATHKIDAVTSFQALDGSWAGTYPEGMAVVDNKVYVALSGQADGIENRVAVVDAVSMRLERYIPVAYNLVDILCVDSHLYAMSSGWYDPSDGWAQKDYGLFEIFSDNSSKKVCEATSVAVSGNVIYYLCAPYVVSDTQIGCFTPSNNTRTVLASPAYGASPTALGAAIDGSYLLIGSYSAGEGGYANYNAPGYVIYYNIGTGETMDLGTDLYGITRFVCF